MTLLEISQRLLLAIIISGAVGFDREFKNRPAGMRTHILVCVGAAVIALVQTQLSVNALQMVAESPELAAVVKSDQTRLIAQVVSGIGFLGAGTIIVTQRSVMGLTTAASLWAVACLGIAAGMGLYTIAISGFVVIQVVLSLLNKVLVAVPTLKKLQIKYQHRLETKEFVMDYFEEKGVQVKGVDFDVEIHADEKVYTNIYTVELPRGFNHSELIEDISLNKNVLQIRLIDA
ncbi:MgtC/SapB family protein [Vagococcus coleopterorum]|uniref:MgtC/SapB family protein n=1 Tax=Vagococcus coleopterorum TaxID=2714946 RepID=A0A6G8AMX7_9ENTE|nr:MgtC/SapB family protein [Vagococcus coleopterorum]QIL46319.1 MgtC/SapB family protein [Vagococcus coleopterorum]